MLIDFNELSEITIPNMNGGGRKGNCKNGCE